MRQYISTCVAMICASSALAFGNDDSWTSGWGMGISEAIIRKGPGNQIYITCGAPTSDYSVTSISFTLIGDSSKADTILLTFDGEAPQDYMLSEGKIESASRAGSSQFEHVIEKFKSKKWVNVRFADGTNATFTLNGAKEAIPDCPPDFSQ